VSGSIGVGVETTRVNINVYKSLEKVDKNEHTLTNLESF